MSAFGTPMHLRVGDYVRLVGKRWEEYGGHPGQLVRVDSVDSRGQASSDVGSIGSLTDIDGNGYGDDMLIEKVENPIDPQGKSVGRIEPTEAQLATFKAAWQAADRLGLTGSRTRAGLIAVLNQDEGPF